MIHRSQARSVTLMACGILLLLVAIEEMITAPRVDTLVVATGGIMLIVANGYRYLHPATESTTTTLLAATGCLLLLIVFTVVLIHKYSFEGIFSTFQSSFDVLYAVMLFVVSVWLIYRFFSLRATSRTK